MPLVSEEPPSHGFADVLRTATDPVADALFAQRLRQGLKRAADISFSLGVLTLIAIPFTIIALAIKLESQGPVFYRVRRVGYRGTPLLMLKFRKMHHGAAGIALTANEDPRLTRVGAFLTRTRLDELPQFWDVLWGRMSLVGPRPEDPSFVSLYDHSYEQILSVRPGITGLSQLAFAQERTILDPEDLIGDYIERILPQKVHLDLLYSRGYGPRMDVAVLVWTVAAMIMGRPVAVHRSNGSLTLRRRPKLALEAKLVGSAQTELA